MEECPICMDRSCEVNTVCGHLLCIECFSRVDNCPFCRAQLDTRVKPARCNQESFDPSMFLEVPNVGPPNFNTYIYRYDARSDRYVRVHSE